MIMLVGNNSKISGSIGRESTSGSRRLMSNRSAGEHDKEAVGSQWCGIIDSKFYVTVVS